MSNSLLQIVDFDLVKVKSDTENPIDNNVVRTKRSHDCNSAENSTLLNRIESAKLKTEEIQSLLCLNSVLKLVKDVLGKADQLQTLIGVNQSHEISDNLFSGDYDLIEDINRLKILLSEVNIRFDNNPRNYLKNDYFALLRVLNKSLIFLYSQLGEVTDYLQLVSEATDEAKKQAEYAKNMGLAASESSQSALQAAGKANTASELAITAATAANEAAKYAKQQGDYAKSSITNLDDKLNFVSYYETSAQFPVTGEQNRLYVDLSTNKIYLYKNGYIDVTGSGSDVKNIEFIDGNF